MLFATAFAHFCLLRAQGDGFGGHQGFPFAWHVWIDAVIDGKVSGEYRWVALAADFVIWFAAILVFGLLVERTAHRLFKPRGIAQQP